MQDDILKIIGIIFGVLLIFASLLFIKANYLDQPTLITVVGEGKIDIKPQMVMFTANLVNSAKTSSAAVSNNTKLVSYVISLVKSLGVEDKDIIVSYVQIVPTTNILGQTEYQAVNTIDITLKDLSRFDSLVQSLYNTGTYSITNIVFTTENSRDVEKQAVAKAVDDANLRANEIAKSLNKSVARIVSLTPVEIGASGATGGKTSQGSAGQSPSQIEIVRQAQVVFELR